MRADRPLRVSVAEPRGAASGVTVFLTHGAGGRAAQWRLVEPVLLRAGHRVVTFDALGHGDSPAPPRWRAYSGREWVADLQALIARHGRSTRDVLVGHSYGCLITLGALIAGTRPVQGVVLAAPPLPWAMRRPPWISFLPVPVLERLRPALSAQFRAAAWGPRADVALVDHETLAGDRNDFLVFKAMWRQWLRLVPSQMVTLHTPVQLLVGEHDLITPPAAAQALQQALPRARLRVVADCGHQMPLERPQSVVDAVLAFAGDVRGARR